jgi:site-specific recombinase XerC
MRESPSRRKAGPLVTEIEVSETDLPGPVLAAEMVTVEAKARNPVVAYLATLASSSRVTMSRSLRLLAGMLSGAGADPLRLPWHELRHEHVAALRGALSDRFAPATANRHIAALRGVLKASWRLGLMDAEALARATDVPCVRGSTLPAGREITHGEIAALIRACDDSPRGRRDGAIIALGYGSGLRRAELAALDLDDVDLDEGAVRVDGKGSKQRLTYLASGGRELIERWLDVRGGDAGHLLHPVKKGGEIEHRSISAHGVYRALGALRRRAGLKSLSPHDLRRSWVSHLLEAGADIAVCQRLAGHSSPTTTARYDKRPEEAKRKASRLLHLPV